FFWWRGCYNQVVGKQRSFPEGRAHFGRYLPTHGKASRFWTRGIAPPAPGLEGASRADGARSATAQSPAADDLAEAGRSRSPAPEAQGSAHECRSEVAAARIKRDEDCRPQSQTQPGCFES